MSTSFITHALGLHGYQYLNFFEKAKSFFLSESILEKFVDRNAIVIKLF